MLRFFVAAALAIAAVPSLAATFTVTNLNDSGAGSLRDAVMQANAAPGADAINFAVTGTIVLTSGQIQISDSLTIIGPGSDELTIDGNANGRVFSIFATDPPCPALDGSDYLVTISGVRLTNGKRSTSSSGGAIFSEHSLALNAVVIDNSAAAIGGGLHMFLQYPTGQTLTISNSQFLNNVAKPVGPVPSYGDWGGAIYVNDRCTLGLSQAEVSIANSVFSGNSVQPLAASGFGGAIGLYNQADVTISDTRIIANHIDVPNPPVSGQIYYGGGLYGLSKSLTILGSEIAENNLIDATGSDQTRGGGMGLQNREASLQASNSAMAVSLIDSTVSGNVASATAGAIFAIGNVALAINNSTVANNAAAANRTGGILLTTATAFTGGIVATAPTLTLTSSILADSAPTTLDIASNVAVIPSLTVSTNNSLIGSVCSTCNISLSGVNNLLAVDPLLAPLAFNGGPTRTQALLPTSPAIDAGSNPQNLITDQRGPGFPRVIGAAADVGAYEYRPPVGAIPTLSQFALAVLALVVAGTGLLVVRRYAGPSC